MTEVIAVLLGTLIGFVLSEWSAARREGRSEKRQAAAVRALLSLEIDRNLAQLRSQWSELAELRSKLTGDEFSKAFELASKYMAMPTPGYSLDAYQSQLALLPIALSEQDVVRVVQCYDRFSELDTLKRVLATLRREQTEAFRAASRGSNYAPFGTAAPFQARAPELWGECESLFAQALAKGNPLKTPRQPSAAEGA